ncbi:ATP-grasp domain-containing protein [Leuconostocaceae bacterium ESL0723]|nr:ATP-grasp domain-containing protein [Leuconostocaceae bacterium ESL0723]
MDLRGKRVLVTGARSPIALALMQEFINAGVQVWTTDSVDFALGKSLKGIQAFTLTASCRYDNQTYLDQINQQVADFKIDLIVPTNEETFWLSRGRDQLKAPLFAADFATMAQLHHKEHYAQVLQDAGLLAPHAYNEPGPDRILKNDYSRFTSVGDANLDQPHFYQEKITGKEWCLSLVAEKGEVLGAVVYDKAFNFQGSSSVLIKNHHRPDIVNAAARLIEHTNYTGFFGADIMESAKTGGLYFIDINPRATSGLVLFNADFWDGQPLRVKTPRRTDLALVPDFFRHPLKTWQAWRESKSFFSDISVSWPTWLQIDQVWHWYRYGKQHHVNLRQASVDDIAWDGEFN